MSHAVAFLVGVALGIGALIWLDDWTTKRNARFTAPPDWARG
jgi:hypothetical protein